MEINQNKSQTQHQNAFYEGFSGYLTFLNILKLYKDELEICTEKLNLSPVNTINIYFIKNDEFKLKTIANRNIKK